MYFPKWAKNILFLLVYMISGLMLVIIIDGLLSGTDLQPLNTLLEQSMVAIRTPLLTTVIVWLTNLGSPFVLASIGVFIAVVLVMKGNTHDALLFVVSMIVAVVSFTVLKNTFQIPRPDSPLIQESTWSFPSGHATISTTFFFLVAHSYFHKAKTALRKTLLVTGCIVGTALICLSRLYLGAHWALDILGGIALGLLSVSFTVLVFNVFFGEGRWGIKRPDL